MKFKVRNRFTGNVQFTAEIECDDGAHTFCKLGLAVRWAYKSDADLRGADLRGAVLSGAVLRDADLSGADLTGADLSSADLRGAVLSDAVLSSADLRGADLRGADLRGAVLSDAVLSSADLRGADLRGAVLSDADLSGADLSGAVLRGADLRGAVLGDAVLSGHKLAGGDSFAEIGKPDGWRAYTFVTNDRQHRVIVGCRNFSLAEGRAYWAGKDDRREVLAALDYAAAIGRIRGWTVEQEKEVA